MLRVISLIGLLSLIPLSCQTQASFGGKSIIDLSHSYNSNTLHWITARPYELKVIQNGTTRRGEYNIWVQSDEIHMATHTGTHIDAPCHFAKGRWSIAEIPFDRLIDRPIAVIDVSDQSVATRDYETTIDDIKSWEDKNGEIEDGAVVILRTGWARFWPSKLEYFGTESTDTSLLHFPGLDPNAAEWLVDKRKIVGIGIDGPSIDHGQSKEYKSHQILASKNIYIIENIAKTVHGLPPVGARLFALPLKLEGASGAPCTIIAYLDSSTSSSSNNGISVLLLLLLFSVLEFITC